MYLRGIRLEDHIGIILAGGMRGREVTSAGFQDVQAHRIYQ